MVGVFVPPDPRDNLWDKKLSRTEEIAACASLYGFDETTAKRLCFQRWLRKYRTNETYERNPGLLFYPNRA